MRPSLVPPTTPAIQLAFPAGTCGFESSMCHYYNLKSNGVDWVRRASATPSFNTRPTVDHTTGKTSGHYVYIESSGLPANSMAMLESPVYQSTENVRNAIHFIISMDPTSARSRLSFKI